MVYPCSLSAVDPEAAKQAALRSIKTLNRDRTELPRRKEAPKTLHPVTTASDEDELNLEDEPDQPRPTTPANPSELTEEEIVASYVARIEKVQAKQARDSAQQARIMRAARNLKSRPVVYNAYV
ncbi:hypothetical protein COCC4DRAFT_56840 [Bipolaris maydis ATCC 48331]|uniref:Uncharacterized protein n=2 Tax=Cochliobolus heterostrophus TaxID=5016 RepID=M2U9R0_COCH5|nr:uncharacterized protein COCC4DRAFT_56840 [Bipolaris maydis ATCC 48331]EMD90471.1 hypothetical protein COCHEDRAFT_1157480 [Bipolaris maydis C5]ENI09316.1 hypothetical protein COCC4DRAFT_56840 [Bipolaris maydis ATCC 48331]